MKSLDMLKKATALRESCQLEEARALILELIEAQPANPLICYQAAWIHDALGLEKEAVPFYKKALQLGLSGDEKRGALLGLGSTYRALGQYHNSKGVLEQAIEEFPHDREFQVFYAMVLYNLKEPEKAVEILLKQLAETSSDSGICSYRKAMLFYSDKLDQTWD